MHQSLQKKAINWLAQEVRLLQTKVQELEARAAPGTPPTNSSGRLPPLSPEKANRPVRLNLSEVLSFPPPKRFAFDPQAPVFCPTVPAFHDLKPPAGQELYSNDGGCAQQNCNESLKGNDGMALVQNQGNCPGGLSQDILDSLAVREEDIQGEMGLRPPVPDALRQDDQSQGHACKEVADRSIALTDLRWAEYEKFYLDLGAVYYGSDLSKFMDDVTQQQQQQQDAVNTLDRWIKTAVDLLGLTVQWEPGANVDIFSPYNLRAHARLSLKNTLERALRSKMELASKCCEDSIEELLYESRSLESSSMTVLGILKPSP